MEDKKNDPEDNLETDKEWEKTHRLPAFDNMLPIIKSMILMVEGEKLRTLEKLEETKKLLQTLKDNQRK